MTIRDATSRDPIRRRRLYQDVLEQLIERVRQGEFAAGDRLPSERELMAFYGVGRPAVREALQALERRGMVTISHGERARLVAPSAETLIGQLSEGARHLLDADARHLDDLKDARLFLEKGLAERAAEQATDEGVAELRRHLEVHERARSRPRDFLPLDMAFHRQIAAMTGNPIFPAIVEAMFAWLGVHYRPIVRLPGAEDITIAEHARIVGAIAARDAGEAGAAMRDHLTRANELYRRFEKPD